jgi:hypothetical protein
MLSIREKIKTEESSRQPKTIFEGGPTSLLDNHPEQSIQLFDAFPINCDPEQPSRARHLLEMGRIWRLRPLSLSQLE